MQINMKRYILIVFVDMIADMLRMLSNKKLNEIVTELFIRGRKVNILLFLLHNLILLYQKLLAKLYTVFHYENSKQMRASANCI